MSETAAARRFMRLELRERRANLGDDDQAAASMAVLARLARIPVLREARLVSGYRAVAGEVDIDAALILLGERGAVITVPRVVGEHLEFVQWTPDQPTVSGSFAIPEPIGDDVVPLRRHDVVLAPLVAFDSDGHRLGQGGGYYDRALDRCGANRPVTIGIAHSFQQVETIAIEDWDVAIDAVVTEDEVIEFRPGVLDVTI